MLLSRVQVLALWCYCSTFDGVCIEGLEMFAVMDHKVARLWLIALCQMAMLAVA